MLELVKRLVIKLKVPVDIKTKDSGVTPLHCAARYGHIKVVDFLVERGANIFQEDNRQITALHYAALSGQPDIFEKLYYGMDEQKRKNITKEGRRGHNLLHLVALSGDEKGDTEGFERSKKLAQFIIDKYGPSMIAGADHKGCTPLQFAALQGNKPLVELLIEHNVVRSLNSQKIRSAARVAHKEGHYEIENLINDQLILNHGNSTFPKASKRILRTK